ncbi:MAG: M1 family metallopeptidase [Pyrinomonadaceae bacterium]
MRKIAALCLLFVFSVALRAQELYMPRNVKAAYENGTRSMDGKPGKNYWQNTADYNIKISIDPTTRMVTGTEEISYKNNSPHDIEAPAIRLTMNIHRPGAAREGTASVDYLTDGIVIDEFKENGAVREWKDNRTTVQSFRLSKKVASGETLKLSFRWHYELSKESGREGMIHENSFFLAYFYPRIAVFDDIDGWDRVPFTENHEFYNDFNNYVFEVNAPKNFVVWATGDLQNADEVLQPKFAKRLKDSYTSDQIIHVATHDEMKDKEVTLQSERLTWKWKTANISDIAIAVSDNYIWDAGSVVVDKSTGRRASVQSAYNIEAKDFEKMVEYGKHSLSWASENYPGVPYPYSKTTIVRGFADMEYPMMVNDSSFGDPVFARFVAEHEILHTWFPFYMGINERRYGFMDEGWATAFENLIAINDLGKEQATRFFQQFRVNGWALNPSASSDIPIIIAGDSITGAASGSNQYGKAAAGYLALKDLLGDAVFKRSLHEFMNRWNGKHPLPWDMFNSFNDASGQNFNWFFDRWFFSHGYIDLAVAGVAQTEGGSNITLRNVGGFPAPVDIKVTFEDGSTGSFHQTPAIWAKNQNETTVNIPVKKAVKSVDLDGGIFVDANKTNNSWAK